VFFVRGTHIPGTCLPVAQLFLGWCCKVLGPQYRWQPSGA